VIQKAHHFVAAKTFTPKLGNNYSRKTVRAVLDLGCCKVIDKINLLARA